MQITSLSFTAHCEWEKWGTTEKKSILPVFIMLWAKIIKSYFHDTWYNIVNPCKMNTIAFLDNSVTWFR